MNALSFETPLLVCLAGAMVGCHERSDTSQARAPIHAPPSISEITNQTTSEDLKKTVAFTIGAAGTPLSELRLFAHSSSPEVVAATNITFEGNGAERQALIEPTPHAFGRTLITIKLSDGSAETNRSFRLDVWPVGGVPNIQLKSSHRLGAASPDEPVGPHTNATAPAAGPGR